MKFTFEWIAEILSLLHEALTDNNPDTTVDELIEMLHNDPENVVEEE